jgi:hypothetical protein
MLLHLHRRVGINDFIGFRDFEILARRRCALAFESAECAKRALAAAGTRGRPSLAARPFRRTRL